MFTSHSLVMGRGRGGENVRTEPTVFVPTGIGLDGEYAQLHTRGTVCRLSWKLDLVSLRKWYLIGRKGQGEERGECDGLWTV